mmetsp:Transcript_12820/g.24203  ORF Transcript_12820/g.24203 Transcript_12820/m.24203 type:complete len:396 (+) Transcript_12820:2148-3335(+)
MRYFLTAGAILLLAIVNQQRHLFGVEAQQGSCFDTLVFRIKNDANLQYFSNAITDTGLDTSLDGPGPYLVFAPTDSAFENIKSETPEVLNLELRKLIEYHISATSGYDKYKYQNELYGQGSSFKLETLCSECNKVTVEPMYTSKILLNQNAYVVETIQTCNGLLVTLDKILVPRERGSDYESSDRTRRDLGEESLVDCSLNDPTCCDIQPPQFTCVEQKIWGKCDETWLINEGFCRYTCGRCGRESEEDKDKDKDCDYDYGHEVKKRTRGRKKKSRDRKKKKVRGTVRKIYTKPHTTSQFVNYKKRDESTYRSTLDPCTCTNSGFSGSVDTGRKGCFKAEFSNSRGRGNNWIRSIWKSWSRRSSTYICYVVDPGRCSSSEESAFFPGASWKRCKD